MAKPPRNPKEIQSFMALAKYFEQSIPHFQNVADPLARLSDKGSGWKGGELPVEALNAFEALKRGL